MRTKKDSVFWSEMVVHRVGGAHPETSRGNWGPP